MYIYRSFLWFSLLSILCGSVLHFSTVFAEPIHACSINENLTQSPWPIAHHDNCATDSSDWRGPVSGALNTDYIGLQILRKSTSYLLQPISLLYSKNKKIIWGSAMNSIFVLDRSGAKLKLMTYEPIPLHTMVRSMFHGAYSLLAIVDGEENFVTAGIDGGSAVLRSYRYDQNTGSIIPRHLTGIPLGSREHVVGLNITFDGWIIYLTNKGKVGAVKKDFSDTVHGFQLPGDETLDISNSAAVDSTGGIYIVSNEYMQRVNWDSQLHQFSLAWATKYDSGSDTRQKGRLGTGSGSTPSIMGDAVHGYYVVITDGAKLMNLNVFNAQTGDLLVKSPVNFGDKSISEVTSEQSVLVNGFRAVVVNNQFNANHPIIFGEAPMGVEQFRFDPKTKTLTPTWSLNTISVPNGVPVMSSKTGLMYAIAKRKLHQRTGAWGLVGIDWETGKVKFFHRVGRGLKYNSAYACAEIGFDGEIITGTALGVLRLKEKSV